MFRDVFLVVRRESGESAQSITERQKNLIDEVLGMCSSDLGSVRTVYQCDPRREMVYSLSVFDHDIDESVERAVKHEVLEGRFRGMVDVLFSESFPCFCPGTSYDGALVMDMDMTTVQIECIDEIARCLNVFDQVAAITSEAMHGKLDFAQSLTRRVALLKGGDAESVLEKVRGIMVETDGLNELLTFCNVLKNADHGGRFKTCIASGGFHDLIDVIVQRYGIDAVRANRLETDDNGLFTGRVSGPIIDAQAKADLVVELRESGTAQQNIIVLGDGANDLKMMAKGGLGIAYHAKPKVQQEARNCLNIGTLAAVRALLQLKADLNTPA